MFSVEAALSEVRGPCGTVIWRVLEEAVCSTWGKRTNTSVGVGASNGLKQAVGSAWRVLFCGATMRSGTKGGLYWLR